MAVLEMQLQITAGVAIQDEQQSAGALRAEFRKLDSLGKAISPDLLWKEFSSVKIGQLPVIIIVENWTDRLKDMENLGFPEDAQQLLRKLAMRRLGDQLSGALPTYNAATKESRLVIEFMRACNQNSQCASQNKHPVQIGQVDYHPVQLFACSYSSKETDQTEAKTFIFFFADGLGSSPYNKLKRYYTETNFRRWRRLAQNHLWALEDLVYLYVDWSSILDSLRKFRKNSELSAYKEEHSVMAQTRLLHMHIGTVIQFRELLRLQQAIVRHAMSLIRQYERVDDTFFKADSLNYLQEDFELLYRFRAIDDQMSYSRITVDNIADQLQNLLQLVCLPYGVFAGVEHLGFWGDLPRTFWDPISQIRSQFCMGKPGRRIPKSDAFSRICGAILIG
ncbi:hypothetical protein K469DRAFT_753615 [Zopfia rhizophila CBS 207.26]|uniref:Uncharacterized protein n=1 Tax=Zopfia rhizophila CBS 207.26 TaxID=1314779 RepID=A0A6A6DPJ1_9PEZI|nr:hypothetical protein K469DRAFT_753615 [Zopfia rhizophila CBS 207.26]